MSCRSLDHSAALRACFARDDIPAPLYLTGMSVSVAHQRAGLGRLAIEDAMRVARDWTAEPFGSTPGMQ